jgi:hypothetical protein
VRPRPRIKHFWKIVALLAALFVAFQLFELWRGGLKWKGGLSADGLVTLLGGLLAFLAIMIQLEAERNARTHERQRQKRAVATAIALEIDSIYRGFLRDVEVLFKSAGPDVVFERDLMAKRIGHLPFTVYERCAHLLGGLPSPLVDGIVHFYGGDAVYLMNLNELYIALQRAQAASTGDRRRAEVAVLVQQVKDMSANLGKLAAEVLERLCVFAEIPKDRMAVLSGPK